MNTLTKTALFALPFFTVAIAPIGSMAQSVDDSVVGSEIVHEGGDDFWTAERMKAAVAMPLPVVEGGDDKAAITPKLEVDGPEYTTRAEVTRPAPPLGKVEEAHGIADFPFSPIGKLFFLNGGNPGMCSGAYIYWFDAVLTAAHCVMDEDGNLYSDMHFFRTYDHGGVLPTWKQHMTVKSAWVSARYPTGKTVTERVPYDFALLCVEKSTGGSLPLWLGPVTLDRRIVSFGYPVNFDDGNTIQYVQTQTAKLIYESADHNWGTVQVADDPMGHGSSGGPWMRTDGGSIQALTVGLTSSGNQDSKTVMSPYFGTGFWAVLQNAHKKC